jgi:formylglycine-generating enzyme required for sulfatase activity
VRQLVLAAALTGLIIPAASRATPGKEQNDREFQECRDCPVMVGIPAGSFTMGSPAKESGRFDSEGPQHEVTIKAFALGKYDVTSEQFLAFLKDTGYQPVPCNPTLDMGWDSTGHGRAAPPYEGDLPGNLPVFVRSAARAAAGGSGEGNDYSGLAGFRVARDLP